MEKIGIIYWPKNGSVENVAKKIYERFDKANADIYDILSIEATDLVNYDCLIMGGSTVGAEIWQEAQANNKWNIFFNELNKLNLKKKEVAIFGLGDQILYPNNFVDGMALIKEEFEKRGAKIIGKWSTEGYRFKDSLAIEGDKFLGLAIDEDQQAELTDQRIDQWIELLKKEMNR
jgi:flavodoxin I